MIPTVYCVEDRHEEYSGTFTLRIRPQKQVEQSAFQPGQFNMLYAFGAGEVPISMSGSARENGQYIHTIRSHGLATQALGRLRKGDRIGVRGPFGVGWPMAATAGKQVLIVAGGLGLAPLRPVVYRSLEDQRDFQLFYGARSPEEMLFREELRLWSQQCQVALSVDCATSSWDGHVGAITGPLSTARFDPRNTVAFVCGPEVMMRFCIQILLRKGLPDSAIYLSMERNMKCATGLCGHCQWGPRFICKDGPVVNYGSVRPWLAIPAL